MKFKRLSSYGFCKFILLIHTYFEQFITKRSVLLIMKFYTILDMKKNDIIIKKPVKIVFHNSLEQTKSSITTYSNFVIQ